LVESIDPGGKRLFAFLVGWAYRWATTSMWLKTRGALALGRKLSRSLISLNQSKGRR
jgi:hypothetical protein